MSLSINARECSSFHFSGIYGSGMSALAQFLVWSGARVSGSDRMIDDPDCARIRSCLEAAGCVICNQDGSGIGPHTDVVVVSTAIEESNPDMKTAQALGIAVVHRSDVLAALVATHRSIAVAGTSGKSTVTTLCFELLTACGHSPSLIGGANVTSLSERGLIGNAFKGESDILVVEADESDGTVVKYHPALSVILNVSRDHKPVPETTDMFRTLARQSRRTIANADDAQTATIDSHLTFGLSPSATVHPDEIGQTAPHITFSRNGVSYISPLAGRHNLSNLMAALAVCGEFGCTDRTLSPAAARFQGLKRRFEVTCTPNGVTVIDDFAHNPEKIRAALETAQAMSDRVFAVFQPHGFAPTKFMKDDLVAMFRTTARPGDEIYILPIYYAGGTAVKSISSDDLVSLINAGGGRAFAPQDRAGCVEIIAMKAQTGDAVLVMGARDPSLPNLTRDFLSRIGSVCR